MADKEFRIEEHLLAMEARLAALEAERMDKPGKPGFWRIGDWTDLVKLLGLPLAATIGCLTFYDQVWTRQEKAEAVRMAEVQTRIREIQELNAGTYERQARGDMESDGAIAAAMNPRMQRLVAEVHAYWQENPDYFTPAEAQALSNELLMFGNPGAALEIADGLAAEETDAIGRADAALFRARILSAEGGGQDLDAARAALGRALDEAADVQRSIQRADMRAKIAYYGLFMELWNETGCETADAFGSILYGNIAEEGASLGVLEDEAAQLIEVWHARCGG